jgi:trigger factor
VLFNSQRLGVAPEEYFSRLQEGNQLGAVFAEVRRGKALASAVEQATVTNASGDVLDVAALFGIEAEDEAEELIAEEIAEEIVAEEIAEEIVEEIEAEVLAEEIVEFEEALAQDAVAEQANTEESDEAAATGQVRPSSAGA